jgi:hypothetical protein
MLQTVVRMFGFFSVWLNMVILFNVGILSAKIFDEKPLKLKMQLTQVILRLCWQLFSTQLIRVYKKMLKLNIILRKCYSVLLNTKLPNNFLNKIGPDFLDSFFVDTYIKQTSTHHRWQTSTMFWHVKRCIMIF